MTDAALSRFPWPPVTYLIGIAAAVGLNALAPLPWIGQPMSDLLFAIGCLLVVGAIIIQVSSVATMRKFKTTTLPTKAADHLVTSGPFGFSRNPIYLALTLLLLGIGLITGIVWFIPAALIAAFIVRKMAIEPEEKHLAQRFGKKYHDYAKRVRRWI